MVIDAAAWAELALRWLHLTAGIAWIGSSFYFIWLDNSLEKRVGLPEGVAGELWAVHGGGFYHKQKYSVAPAALPEHLHWFKWEAYFTWLSGFGLLAVLYYLGAELYLIDPAKADFSKAEAIGISLAFLVGGWLVYNTLCRSPLGADNKVLGLIWFALLTACAFVLQQLFNDRAAYLQVGAIIGTVMAANVAHIIIPNQRKAVAAMLAGEAPDPALGKAAKQRSLHNNYMTLPVLFIMISNHYPMTYSHPHGWAILAMLGGLGMMIRHVFNRRHIQQKSPALIGAAIAASFAIIVFAALVRPAPARIDANVATTDMMTIVSVHCQGCHAARPAHQAFDAPPGGVILETPDHVERYGPKIIEQAVRANIMPLGNETGMTDQERALLAAWIEAVE